MCLLMEPFLPLELLVPLPSYHACAITLIERLHVSQARACPRRVFLLFFDIRGTPKQRNRPCVLKTA